MGYSIEKTDYYCTWYDDQTAKFQGQIQKRLQNISNHCHFGQYPKGFKDLEGGLWEIKFNNGVRIYYVHTDEKEITLLDAGDKNSQQKDITRCKGMIERGEI